MIFLGLVLVVVLFVFGLKFAGVFMTRMSERFVTSKFRAAESLLEDGRIPQSWMDAVERRVFRDWTGRPRPDAEPELQTRAREALLQMLGRLIKYFEKCPFFDNPETRELMMSRLRAIAESWRDKDWIQISRDQASEETAIPET